MTDKQLALLQEWYQCYGEELYRTLCNAVRSSDMARDISQEAFLKMAVKLSKNDTAIEVENQIENPRAFLYKIAFNEVYTWHRRQKLERHLCEMFSDPDYEFVEHITPEEIALSREELDSVRHVIDKLPSKQRQVFLLSRGDNMTHSEIATQLGIKKGSVKQHIVRALQMLRGVSARE